MTTAKEFSKHAAHCEKLAAEISPSDKDPYGDSRKLAVYHLRNAARLSREIAAHLAQEESGKA